MDYDSSNKFISSLAKFLQSLCNGYVEFNNGVQVIGHIYLSVDTGKTIDYVLNEKVNKTDENSVTFISNSFHATPAEKPKPPGKSKDTAEEGENENSQSGLGSTNNGTTTPSSRSKRPHSPSGRSSPRNKRNRTDSSDINLPQTPLETQAQGSVQGSLETQTDNYQASFFGGEGENEEQEERDVKPSFDTDVTFIKEEYASSNSAQSGQDHDRGGEDFSSYSPYPNQPYTQTGFSGQPGYSAPGSQRSTYNPAGVQSSIPFSGGQSQYEGGDMSSDPSAKAPNIFGRADTKSTFISRSSLICQFCGKRCSSRRDLQDHTNGVHLKVKPFQCDLCHKAYVYKKDLKNHRKFGHFAPF